MLGKAYLVLCSEAVFPASWTSAETSVEMLHVDVNQVVSASALKASEKLAIGPVLCNLYSSFQPQIIIIILTSLQKVIDSVL